MRQWKEPKTDAKSNIAIDSKKIGEAISKPINPPVNTNSEPEKIEKKRREHLLIQISSLIKTIQITANQRIRSVYETINNKFLC